MTAFEKRIHRIPGAEEDPWWKSSSEDTYQRLGKQLLRFGMSEDVAIDFLEDAYFAAANCFGG